MSGLSCEHCGGRLQFGHRCRAEVDALRRELAEVKRSERSLALEWGKADRRVSASYKVMREVEAELRFRASQTNDFGQIEPPYTSHSLLSMADELASALSSEDATRPTGDGA